MIYALFCGEKFNSKLGMRRKTYKYQIDQDHCLRCLLASSPSRQRVCQPRAGYGHLWVVYPNQNYYVYDNDSHRDNYMYMDIFHNCQQNDT